MLGNVFKRLKGMVIGDSNESNSSPSCIHHENIPSTLHLSESDVRI